MRLVCASCRSKDLLDQVDISSMEEGLAEHRERHQKVIFRFVGLAVGLLIVLLAMMSR